MGLKSMLARPYARYVASNVRQWSAKPHEKQNEIFRSLLGIAQNTYFGKEHGFQGIKSYEEYKLLVPIRDYEQTKGYINRIIEGEKNILWPGMPIYFAKTSGTTSGMKYIPITKDSIGNHFFTAQTALMLYMAESGKSSLMNGKMIFLSGSPVLEKAGDIPAGRLSGIVNHHIPAYLRSNQLPSYQTNCIEDWEEKIEKIVDETINQNMTLISGIPPWVQMYFDKLVERTGKPVKDIFPNFEVFVYGGVNYEPYRSKLEKTIGCSIPSIETYPASEGFLAFQDTQTEEGLLLNINSGIFFEFVPAGELFSDNPTRLSLMEVELGVNYAVIINSNAGLWAYNLGDTVKFVSKSPYRIIVTGRVKHFISAFGEHVISEEVESCMRQLASEENLDVVEFTVAPSMENTEGLPCHEWFVEFTAYPDRPDKLALKLDELMCGKNTYYTDLVHGKILQPLKLRVLQKNAFRNYMKEIGKLGGQNKVPRLSNDRSIANQLDKFIIRRTESSF